MVPSVESELAGEGKQRPVRASCWSRGWNNVGGTGAEAKREDPPTGPDPPDERALFRPTLLNALEHAIDAQLESTPFSGTPSTQVKWSSSERLQRVLRWPRERPMEWLRHLPQHRRRGTHPKKISTRGHPAAFTCSPSPLRRFRIRPSPIRVPAHRPAQRRRAFDAERD